MKIIKKKTIFTAILGAVCCGCLFLSAGFLEDKPTAYAATATTPNYSLQFDYTRKTSNGTSTTTNTGTAFSVSVQTGASSYTTASLSIYGSSSSGTSSLAIGGYIRSSTVNLAINSGIGLGNMTVYNSSGTQVGKGNKTLTMTGLSDGKYNADIYFGGGAWATSLRSGLSVSVNGTTSFIVDSNAPTIYGASTSSTGKITNTAFTVSATDSISGATLYMQSPGSSTYSAVGTSRTISTGSTNGLYRFYAVDGVGNTSSTYYAYYDNVLPSGSIKNTSGSALSLGYTNSSFYYSATDSGSGISILQYKVPGSSSWVSYTSGTTISSTSTSGTYRFRSMDKAGNYSAESTVILDTTKPKGVIYGGSTALTSGGFSNASYLTYVGSDVGSGVKNTYVKYPGGSTYLSFSFGTQFATEGTYYFYTEDLAGNISETYSVTLDRTPPKLLCSQTSFNTTYGTGYTVSLSDSADTLFYKTPSMSYYMGVVGSSVTIKETEKSGKSYFYAVDKAGNISETYWIDLQVNYPSASVMKSTTDNSVCVVWTDSSLTGKLNGNSYVSGTWIKTEGYYSFVITNKYGQTNTYSFTIDHNYIIDSTISGSCTTDGYTVYKCTSCGKTYNGDYHYAKGHQYEETVHAVSCTEDGYTEHKCLVCGDEFHTNEITATGHSFKDEIIPVSCTEIGCVKHVCEYCGYAYNTEEKEALGHSYDTSVLQTCSCVSEGKRGHTCERCGDYYETIIPATGHNYQLTKEETIDKATIRTYVCSECGDEKEENIGNTYEKVSNYVEYLFEQYSPYMWWVFLATTSVWSAAIGIAIIIAHKNEDKEKTRKMLVNYVIGLVVIAAIVVACPYLVRGIAILVT